MFEEVLTPDILLTILVALAALIIVLLGWIIRLEMRIKRLVRGKGARSIEDSILSLDKDVNDLHSFRSELEKYLELAETRIRRSVQGVGTVRFNPFQGTGAGGNQSFATAILNEEGNGVVLSSLYSRERVSVYAKPVEHYQSEYELTEEEREAIEKAKTT